MKRFINGIEVLRFYFKNQKSYTPVDNKKRIN